MCRTDQRAELWGHDNEAGVRERLRFRSDLDLVTREEPAASERSARRGIARDNRGRPHLLGYPGRCRPAIGRYRRIRMFNLRRATGGGTTPGGMPLRLADGRMRTC